MQSSSHASDVPANRANAWDRYSYQWPRSDSFGAGLWRHDGSGDWWVRDLPESAEELKADSRWPGFFPSPMCVVTTYANGRSCLEKVVGPSIVNRFPYVCALSFCRTPLSERHYARRAFADAIESGDSGDSGGQVAVQFLPPGPDLDRVMTAILEIPDERAHERIAATGLSTRPAAGSQAPVFDSAYLVYEGALARPKQDFSKRAIFQRPYHDVGSHRIYFFEIDAIQLDREIAVGGRQINWFSLPKWSPELMADRVGGVVARADEAAAGEALANLEYQKSFRADYRFPAKDTVAFEFDEIRANMAVKYLSPLPEDQVEVDNDRARWPCFFPSSAGMITTNPQDGPATCMPCGSTTVVSRHPLVIAPCISYSAINVRYAPRASLKALMEQERFGCGVPFAGDQVLDAIAYLGNVSYAADRDKIAHSGLHLKDGARTPILAELPIHFDCKVIDKVHLGTHLMFLGEVERVFVRPDVTPENPLAWCPWPVVADVAHEEP